MILFLSGVLVTQADPAPGVARNPRKALSFPLGADVTVRLQVVDSSGAPVPLDGAGTSAVLTIKRAPSAVDKLLSVPGELPGPLDPDVVGVMMFQITALAQRSAFVEGPGQVCYDVWLTRSGRRDAVVPVSPMYVEPGVADIVIPTNGVITNAGSRVITRAGDRVIHL